MELAQRSLRWSRHDEESVPVCRDCRGRRTVSGVGGARELAKENHAGKALTNA
jgi:hypothetical protein